MATTRARVHIRHSSEARPRAPAGAAPHAALLPPRWPLRAARTPVPARARGGPAAALSAERSVGPRASAGSAFGVGR